MLYVVVRVCGVTYLDNIMYVVCEWSSTIRLYNTDTLSPLDVVINVTGMKDPRDVVCRHDRQLYVAECDCIWRVSVDDHSYVKWLTTQSSTDTFLINTLSLTSRRLLVTSWQSPTLRQYNTVDSQLLHHIPLPQYVRGLRHAVETTRQTFVIGHRGTSQDEWLYAVSELLPVTAVNAFRLSNNIICYEPDSISEEIGSHKKTRFKFFITAQMLHAKLLHQVSGVYFGVASIWVNAVICYYLSHSYSI